MRSNRWTLAALALALVFAASDKSVYSAEEKRLAVFTAHESWVIALTEIEAREYVPFLDLLGHLGKVSARSDRGGTRVALGTTSGTFSIDGRTVRFDRKQITAKPPVVLHNQQILVPLEMLEQLLEVYTGKPADLHRSGRRLFLDGAQQQGSSELKRGENNTLTITFPAPVSPAVNSEGDKVRMIFRREPVVFAADRIDYTDKLIQSVSFTETNGEAELVIQGSAPLLAAFSDGGRTIQISAAPAPTMVAQTPQARSPVSQGEAPATPATPAAGQAPSAILPLERPETPAHFFVMIDPAHGGEETGVRFSDKLLEKDVTLELARRLRLELQDRGISAVLSRDDDSAHPSDERAALANSRHAGMFISLHAGGPGRGVRVYTALTPANAGPSTLFMPWQIAQSGSTSQSLVLANAMVSAMAEKKVAAQLMPAAVPPLGRIAAPAIAIEIAPQKLGANIETIKNQNYQNSIMQAATAAIVEARKQIGGSR